VDIISYLAEKNPIPPKDLEQKSFDELTEELKIIEKTPRPRGTDTQLQAILGSSTSQDIKAFIGLKGEKRSIDNKDIKTTATVIIKDCQECELEIDATYTKLVIHNCQNVTFTFRGKIVTSIAEFYKCTNLIVNVNTTIKTIQPDMCEGIQFKFKTKEDFFSIIWAGTEKLSVSFDDEEQKLSCGYTEECQSHPKANYQREIDQFKIHFVNGKLKMDKLIRLKNGFPTTKKEDDEFEHRQKENMKAWEKNNGIKVVRKDPIKKDPNVQPRNAQCNCGSGKKYKNCCGKI